MKKTMMALPVAAFALMGTSAYAFNSDMLVKAGLDEAQVAAFEQAHELKKQGDRDAARDVLAEAGIDLDTLEEVRNVLRTERGEQKEQRQERRAEVKAAVESEDFTAYRAAIADTRASDKVTTAAEFEQLVAAHELRLAGDHEGAKEIMQELGFEKRPDKGNRGEGKRGGERSDRS